MMDPLTLDAIERLRKLGGQPFLIKMIDLFLDFGGQKVIEAETACAGNDFEVVCKAAHAIKSSAGNLGAARVATVAAELESHVREGHTAEVPSLVQDLRAAFTQVTPLLKAQRDAPGTGV